MSRSSSSLLLFALFSSASSPVLSRPAVQYLRMCLSFQLFPAGETIQRVLWVCAIDCTCAMLFGFVKPSLACLPLVVIAHAGPVGQSAPQLTKSSALLLGPGVTGGSLDLALLFIFILLFLVTVCD